MVTRSIDTADFADGEPAEPGLSSACFRSTLARGIRLAWRRRVDAALALAFFLVVIWLFPLVMAPRAAQLPAMAPAVVWVAALLSVMTGGARLFQEDAANGTLEQVLMAPGASAAIAGLMAAHAAVVMLPLLCALPLVAAMYDLSAPQLHWMAASLCLGMPGLCVLSALCAALSLGARNGFFLLTLLMLPLALPLVLFGVQAASGDPSGGWHDGALMLMGAVVLAALAMGPAGVARALEVALE